MASTQAEAIIHPVRLRILMDVVGRERTPYEIGRALPDVAQASLYRHIKRLCEAGVLAVVRETPVRGATEKVYALASGAGYIAPHEFQRLSREEHLRYFADFLASLLSQFRLYLQGDEIDVVGHGVSYRMEPTHLSDEEYVVFQGAIRALIEQARANPPTPERRRRLTAVVQMPMPEEGQRKEETEP